MRKIRTFTDYILSNTDIDSEHQRYVYSNIYGKIIYPVAINPLEYYIFNNRSKYNIIRGNRYVI